LYKLVPKLEQVHAFGDGLNDLEMIEAVGTGIVMGNGHEDLKKLANHVTKDVTLYSHALFNPKIISHSVERTYLQGGEGCLSVDREVPGYVPRYTRITVKAT
ncbi:HAD hydrolase family protein, partial [Bacillus sp. D-CC]